MEKYVSPVNGALGLRQGGVLGDCPETLALRWKSEHWGLLPGILISCLHRLRTFGQSRLM